MKHLEIEYDELTKDLKREDEADLWHLEFLTDKYGDRRDDLEREFVHRFRASIIIQLFSFVEIELKKHCDRHYHKNKKEFSINDIKGNNELDKVKKYLKKSANIDITLFATWQFVDNIRKLRNKLVHHESLIPTTDGHFQSISDFSNNNFSLIFEDDSVHKIVLDKEEFVGVCLTNVDSFFDSVFSHPI